LHAAAARSSSARRRWPLAQYLLALPMLLLAGSIVASSHPATAAPHLMAYLAVVAVLLVCQGYAVYRSSRRPSGLTTATSAG